MSFGLMVFKFWILGFLSFWIVFPFWFLSFRAFRFLGFYVWILQFQGILEFLILCFGVFGFLGCLVFGLSLRLLNCGFQGVQVHRCFWIFEFEFCGFRFFGFSSLMILVFGFLLFFGFYAPIELQPCVFFHILGCWSAKYTIRKKITLHDGFII